MCQDKDGKFYFPKTRLRQFCSGREESQGSCTSPAASFRGGVSSSVPGQPAGRGPSQALPSSQVVPNPANEKEFTGNPRPQDLFFPFQGRVSLKPPLAMDHSSHGQSGAPCGAGGATPKAAPSPG